MHAHKYELLAHDGLIFKIIYDRDNISPECILLHAHAYGVWRAIPHKITELVKKTKITPAYSRFLQPTGEISPAYGRDFSSLLEKFLQSTGEISPA